MLNSQYFFKKNLDFSYISKNFLVLGTLNLIFFKFYLKSLFFFFFLPAYDLAEVSLYVTSHNGF